MLWRRDDASRGTSGTWVKAARRGAPGGGGVRRPGEVMLARAGPPAGGRHALSRRPASGDEGPGPHPGLVASGDR